MALHRYQNRSCKSGIAAYEIGDDYIKVEFVGGPLYLYNHTIPGKRLVDQMKLRAQLGKGLCTLISREVKESYAARLR